METMRKIVFAFIAAIMFGNLAAQSESEIIAAFTESYKLEAKADYSNAIAQLKAVYKEDSYEINLRLGWLTYQSGLFNDSKAYYNKAINLKPYAVEPKFGITYPLSALGKWDEITAMYAKILEIDPNNSTANYKIGMIYYGKGEYKSADKYFDKVVNLYPFGYDALIMLAWTKFQLQEFGKAKVLFNKVLMYSPNDESALKGLSLMQ